MADTPLLACDTTEIAFAPTIMFASKVYRFSVRNPSTIAVPLEWSIVGKGAASFTVSPVSGAVGACSELEVEVRFAPREAWLLCMPANKKGREYS